LLQICQEFKEIAKTEVRLMDQWQQCKGRILELAQSKPLTEQLLENIGDMDEGLSSCVTL